MRDYTKCCAEVYPLLSKQGMWLRGNEINTISKEEYNLRPFRVLFVRLSTYKDVAASFSHLLLYQIASSIPDIFPDLAYLPPNNDVNIFAKNDIPWLLGTQTKLGPHGFNLIGFSNSIVQEILNIPKFLKTSRIPLKRSERLNREDIPIIILGGANAPYTTSIWGAVSLIDGVFMGQNPSCIRKLLQICADGYKNKRPKQQILHEMQDINGFYLTDKNPKCLIPKTAEIEILEKGIISYNEDEIGSGWLQISEGCRALCSFCAENWTRKPYKEIDASLLLKKAFELKKEMGLEKINLYSFNFNMHSQIYKLLWELLPVFKNIGLKSQRFDTLAGDPLMIEYESVIGKTTISSGMEGISGRIRRYLNKNLDDNVLNKSLNLIFKNKIRELKIFLLSTGIENEEDFKEFDKFLDTIKQIKLKYDTKTRVIFSITPLVRFPWTPLESDKAYPAEMHDKIIAKIRRIISNHDFEARQAMDTGEYLISQILVRTDDFRIKNALLRALEQTDFIYYRQITPKFYSTFLANLKNSGLAVDGLLNGRPPEENFTETGIGMDKIKIESPPHTIEEYKETIQNFKNNEVKKDFLINISELGLGINRKYIGTALARALMKSCESLIPYFHSYISSYWTNTCIIGDDIITLSWDKKAIPILEQNLADHNFINQINTHLGRWGALKKDRPSGSFNLRIDHTYKSVIFDYFKKKGLKSTLRKDKEGCYHLEFTKESLKKRIVSGCSFNDVSINVMPGPKFDAEKLGKFIMISENLVQ